MFASHCPFLYAALIPIYPSRTLLQEAFPDLPALVDNSPSELLENNCLKSHLALSNSFVFHFFVCISSIFPAQLGIVLGVLLIAQVPGPHMRPGREEPSTDSLQYCCCCF